MIFEKEIKRAFCGGGELSNELLHRIPRKQCLINQKGHRHAANEGMDSYR